MGKKDREVCPSCEGEVWRLTRIFNSEKAKEIVHFFITKLRTENHRQEDIGIALKKLYNISICNGCILKYYQCMGNFEKLLRSIGCGSDKENVVPVPSTTDHTHASNKRQAVTPLKHRLTPLKDAPVKRQLFATDQWHHDYVAASSPPKQLARSLMLLHGLYFGDYSSGVSISISGQDSMVHTDCGKFAQAIKKIPELYKSVVACVLGDIDFGLKSLEKTTVLRSTPVSMLVDGDLASKAIQELQENCPILLDVMVTAMTGVRPAMDAEVRGRILTIYGVLMNTRYNHFSGLQRLLSLLATKRGLNERGQATLNKLGLTLTNSSRNELLEACSTETSESLERLLESGRLATLVGDNCDMTVRPRLQNSLRQKRSLHFFATLIVFSNASDEVKAMSTAPAQVPDLDDPRHFLPTDEKDTLTLMAAYRVLVGRILADELPGCAFMKEVFPEHREHSMTAAMKRKTVTKSLPFLFNDEKKLEECVEILDSTTEAICAYLEKMEGLTGFPTMPYAGDQLTRIRMQAAKFLRAMAADSAAKFEGIGPFVTALWHVKQDFLEKVYSLLWDDDAVACRDELSLRYFATLWRTKNANGKVKTNYAAHEDLLLAAGKRLIISQAMETFGMSTPDESPKCIPENVTSLTMEERRELAHRLVDTVLINYEYGQFSADGTNDLSCTNLEKNTDEVMSYCTMLTHAALHVMLLNDIAHEGDVDTVGPAMKFNMAFFYAHSVNSHYFVECIDYLLKINLIGSEADRMRIKTSSFVNNKGGAGNCHEIDLEMEHHIRRVKDLVSSLGANKTEEAMRRVTAAADTVSEALKNFDNDIGVRSVSGRHTDSISTKDLERSTEIILEKRPFNFNDGRRFKFSTRKVRNGLFANMNMDELKRAISRNAERLSTGGPVSTEEPGDVVTEYIVE